MKGDGIPKGEIRHQAFNLLIEFGRVERRCKRTGNRKGLATARAKQKAVEALCRRLGVKL